MFSQLIHIGPFGRRRDDAKIFSEAEQLHRICFDGRGRVVEGQFAGNVFVDTEAPKDFKMKFSGTRVSRPTTFREKPSKATAK